MGLTDHRRSRGSSDLEQDAEDALVVLRKNCADLGEVIPAARKLIGRSTGIRQRGYSVVEITPEACWFAKIKMTPLARETPPDKRNRETRRVWLPMRERAIMASERSRCQHRTSPGRS